MSEAGQAESGAVAAARLIDRRGHCRLSFEPIADLVRGAVCGYECLLRFPGEIDPAAWRVEATRRGVEPDLHAFVIGSVLAAREHLPENCFLSFNIDAATLLRDPVQAALARADRLDGLVVELSPRVPAGTAPGLVEAVAALRRAGAKIAIDHVGGEAGVLDLVDVVRPELVKLDPRFVRGIHRDDARRVLLEGIGQLASRFDAWVVAQGVEQIGELDLLMALRVPLAQGPLVGVGAKTLTPVAFSLSSYVRERGAQLAAPGPLMALLEHGPVIERDGDPRVLAITLSATLGADTGVWFVPLIDSDRRPVGMVERAAHVRGEPPADEVLVVAPSARIPDVAQRAMARRRATRFHPLVCCDERGRYLGTVRVERLVEALAAPRDE